MGNLPELLEEKSPDKYLNMKLLILTLLVLIVGTIVAEDNTNQVDDHENQDIGLFGSLVNVQERKGKTKPKVQVRADKTKAKVQERKDKKKPKHPKVQERKD